jgi:DNA polymerase-1
MRTLGKLTDRYQPSRIVVVFDGEGGSNPRKMIYPDYKGQRVNRIMNPAVFSTQEEHDASKEDQIVRLIDFLRCLPVSLVCMDYVEADDVIAWISNWIQEMKPEQSQILASGDRDYFQLINENRHVHYLYDDTQMDPEILLERYGVAAPHYLLYRCLIGDVSDNIPGIAGIGKVKAVQLYPMMADGTMSLSIDEMVAHAAEQSLHKKSSKLYPHLVNQHHQLLLNRRLMALGEHPFTEDEIEYIKQQLRHPRSIDVMTLTELVMRDQLPIQNPENWAHTHFLQPQLK